MLYKQTVLLTGITFLGLTGYVLRLQQLYFMAALVAFVAIGSYIICLMSVRGIALQRGPTRKIYEGDESDVRLTLTSAARLPKAFLTIEDALPQWLEPVRQRAAPAAQEQTDEPARPRFIVPVLLRGQPIDLSYRLRGLKRGAFTLGPLAVSATDALGAFQVSRRLDQRQEVIVYPSPVRVSPEAFAGVRSFGGEETEQLSAAGAGLEFYGIRDYRPGDALRRIHWPSTARLGHFAVVEFEESFGADMVIVLDLLRGTEAGSGRDTSLEAAIKAAASLAAYTVANAASVVVAAQDGQRRHFAVARRQEELPTVLEALARMRADGDTSLSQVMAGVGEQVTGALAVVLTGAPDEAVAAAAESWIRRQAQVVAVLFDAASWGERNAADVYAISRRMEAAGARVEIFRRGDDIRLLLRRAVTDVA
jgi:uncharacterized protein (DUF58 family)